MPHSMTAYARASGEEDWGSLSWEIRSVNHRYLEAGFRLPETLRDLEIPLREKLRKALGRGKIDCSLQLNLNRETEGVEVDTDKAQQYIDASRAIADMMDDPQQVSPVDILKWPGVLVEREVDSEALKARALGLFSQAVDQLIESRAVEGEKLQAFILQRVDAIGEETAKVRALLPEILAAQAQRINDKVADLQVDIETERLEQEIVLIAQKADVDEELDRLDAHLEEIRQVFKRKEPIGRRLDFLMQELNREANTLSSKSIATGTTQIAVELKVLIEQMREQIQNIE